MNQDDKQQLLDRLMQGVSEQVGGDPVAIRIFEESTLEDIEAIEPLIDKIIEREVGLVSGGLGVCTYKPPEGKRP
jgi:hypothetical protein